MARGQLQWGGQDDPKATDAVSEALAALGLYCEDDIVIDEEFWLWPENEEVFLLWCALQTQWISGMGGAIGMNYAGVEACMRLRGVGKKKAPRFFVSIQAMERATLEEWSAK